MTLLLFLDDIRSERELMRIVPGRLDCLWFLGYGLDDQIPDHSVLSKACWLWNGPQFQGDYEGHSFFKEYFLNHQFFNFFENTPAILWLPMPNTQLNDFAGESPLRSP